jgi:spore coat polysaccharide biosynthesis protein SpsF (cytidylyltransferase family)
MTLDYEEDYRFFREVFEALGGGGAYFGLPEIVRLLDSRPEIAAISAAAQAHYERNIARQIRKQNA